MYLSPLPHMCLKGIAPFIGAFLGPNSNTNDMLLYDTCRERIGSTVGEKWENFIAFTAECSQAIKPAK